jgi:hypothetical protein
VFIDANHMHAVEPTRVVDQHALAFDQDSVVGGVPRHGQGFGDPGDTEVLAHDGLQRPPQRAARQLRPRLGGLAGVLAPHMPAAGAPVAADRHQQRRGSPPERLVRQPPGHAVARRSLRSTAATPPVELTGVDPAGQHRPIRLEPLTHDLQAEFVEAAEHAQVRAREGSVRHVEVFRLGGVRTPIIGRPRPSPATDAPSAERYTLNAEEPAIARLAVFTVRM